jgi:hypothetical protein
MTRFLTNLLLVAIIGLAACSIQDPSSPESTSTPTPHPDQAALDIDTKAFGEPSGHHLHADQEALGRQTFQNAYKLERAVWRFADDNNGEVFHFLGDTNLAGKTVFDYLPGKQRLVNPFTGVRSEPRDGFAGSRGQVSYAEILDLQGYLVGFTITAQGVYYPNQYLQLDRYLAER